MQTLLLKKEELAKKKEILLRELEDVTRVEKMLDDPLQVLDMNLADFLPASKRRGRILRALSNPVARIKTVKDLVSHEYPILRYHGITEPSVVHLTMVLKPLGLRLKNPGIRTSRKKRVRAPR